MPTLLIIGPYRFHFYANEGTEPAHVHIEAAEKKAKYWLQPVRLAKSKGFRSDELAEIERLVLTHRDNFLEAWHEFFRKR